MPEGMGDALVARMTDSERNAALDTIAYLHALHHGEDEVAAAMVNTHLRFLDEHGFFFGLMSGMALRTFTEIHETTLAAYELMSVLPGFIEEMQKLGMHPTPNGCFPASRYLAAWLLMVKLANEENEEA